MDARSESGADFFSTLINAPTQKCSLRKLKLCHVQNIETYYETEQYFDKLL